MPEGHLVHRLARDQRELAGEVVAASSPQGRFTAGAAALDGRVLESVEAYGKHLHHRWDAERGLHVHLGMQGKWLRSVGRPPRPQVRLRLAPATSEVAWDLIAPSTCALIDDLGWKGVVAALGPDPLRSDADPERAYEVLRAHPGTIGAAILDQTVIAGVGNVLRAEGLFLAGLHPSRPPASVSRAEFDLLWSTLVRLMAQSMEDGRIISAPLAAEERSTVSEAEGRMVYKQAHCRKCATPVEVFELGARTAYACPTCQAV